MTDISSGSLATLAAIRRASSLLSNFAAERQKNLEGQQAGLAVRDIIATVRLYRRARILGRYP